MEQSPKTIEEVRAIIDQIQFLDRQLVVLVMGGGYYLQVQYMEKDVDTGKMELQKARKWYISSFSTETEIVETAYKALRTSWEHVLNEHFLYKGLRIYSPHFDVQARIRLCIEKQFDGRIPPKK